MVGAGPTGVEMAGQIAELAHRTLKRDFRAINTRNARVILLDAAPQVLPPFGKKLGEHTKKDLEKLGVEVVLGAMVTDLDERGIDVAYKDGRTERIVAVTKIWAAGVQASPLGRTLAAQTGAPLDRAGRIGVNPDLTLPGHPEVFVVGDMIALDNLPGVAQVAIQGAKYAAKSIQRRVDGKPPQPPFKYFDKGSMATISRFKAVALIGKFRLTGFLAWLAWLALHLIYITGFKNRLTALLHWFVSFLGRGRAERTTTEQQIYARAALQRLQGGAADLVSAPGAYDRAQEILEVTRRAELEARAMEEARLTDSGERGQRRTRSRAEPRRSGDVVVGLEHPGERAGVDHRAVDHERRVRGPLDEHPPTAAARLPDRADLRVVAGEVEPLGPAGPLHLEDAAVHVQVGDGRGRPGGPQHDGQCAEGGGDAVGDRGALLVGLPAEVRRRGQAHERQEADDPPARTPWLELHGVHGRVDDAAPAHRVGLTTHGKQNSPNRASVGAEQRSGPDRWSIGRPRGTRTHNLRIKSPQLCQLS